MNLSTILFAILLLFKGVAIFLLCFERVVDD